MRLKSKILFVLLIANSICFGQKTILHSSKFQAIIENTNTKLDRKTYSGGIVKEFYKLKNQRNEWIAYSEFYSNGKIKEQGVFLNGYNFEIWTEYDTVGKIISQIDYSIPKQIVGQNQFHINKFQETLEIGDSIINAHFDPDFIKQIRLNASRSYWYSDNSSGNWFEKPTKNPNEYTLRYSIIIRDTFYFTPIEIRLENKQIIFLSGIPNTSSFKININYQDALDKATLKGYGKLHKTAFMDSELMKLAFIDDTYYWTISRIEKEKQNAYKNINNKTITAIGKTLLINCQTGNITEKDFKGIINLCE